MYKERASELMPGEERWTRDGQVEKRKGGEQGRVRMDGQGMARFDICADMCRQEMCAHARPIFLSTWCTSLFRSLFRSLSRSSSSQGLGFGQGVCPCGVFSPSIKRAVSGTMTTEEKETRPQRNGWAGRTAHALDFALHEVWAWWAWAGRGKGETAGELKMEKTTAVGGCG